MIMSLFTISKNTLFSFFRLNIIALIVIVVLCLVYFSFYYTYRIVYTTIVVVPKLEQQIIRDSLKIEALTESLRSFHKNLSFRIDTVSNIMKDEILPDLTFNSRKVDSLDTYTQILNIRTAPLLHYRP